jgi:hypothetical protein
MTIDATTPVIEIEGIGPATARALGRIRVFTVFDLLRCTPDHIRRAAPKHLGFQEAARLRAAASLSRIRGMTAQWAEGLVAAGVTSIDEFQRNSGRQIVQKLDQDKARRIIRTLPSADAVEAMLKDAVLLQYTGTLLGTVFDDKGKPLAGAVVQLLGNEQTTDARGRFQMFRLPLGRRLPVLRIAHPRFEPLEIEEPPIAPDPDVVSVEVYALRKAKKGANKDGPVALSELNGDTLPTPTGQPLRVVAMAPDAIENGDILMVETIPKRKGPLTLVSRFKGFENGVFIVRTVKVEPEKLPAGVRERDHFRYASGAFKPIAVGAQTFQKAIMLRAMRRDLAEHRIGQSLSNRKHALAMRMEYLAARGFFSGQLLPAGVQATPSQAGGDNV